ncbi:hypothetical protein DUI87_15258 [Hirundo rustica rustica]|uniref:Integrase catalytic domain-containing protein n=1 Tax=Hirundo rustica rustica TaxID=333673 RepID=A0A3M0K3C8_HIRRU|nr:hypothetical protein DUI87_15258 [Hirundo rustica rustica]
MAEPGERRLRPGTAGAAAPGSEDEEANPAEEEDEEVWEDGDNGHRRLGEAQLQSRANQSLQGRHRSTCKGKDCSMSTEAPWQYSNPSSSSIDQSRLIQAALGKGEAAEHLQYINDIIVWGNTAMEVFEKGEKIIHILLEAGFAIKKSKVKGPAREIQFLKVKWQDGRWQIPTEVINKTTAMSPPTSKKETQASLGPIGFWRMHIPEYSQTVSPPYLVTHKKNDFHWGPEQQQAFAQIKQEITRVVAFDPVRIRPEVEKANWQRRGKPIWAANEWKDTASRVEKLPVKVCQVDAQVPKSRANEEHQNNKQVDQAAKTQVSKTDLDWQHKGELFLARWAHDASGHQGRDATYEWARDRGVDLTMDSISQVIHDCETCAAIKQAKRVKPLWYGGQWSKYKYGEAWQIDYITLPQTHQGQHYVLTMVEATTGRLETYPVPRATARNTILGLEKQILWRHGTPERIESDNGTHFKNSLINTWAREHGIEWIDHIHSCTLRIIKPLPFVVGAPATGPGCSKPHLT